MTQKSTTHCTIGMESTQLLTRPPVEYDLLDADQGVKTVEREKI